MDMSPIYAAIETGGSSITGVLATIAGVKGHSYRKAGAALLITKDGERIGTLSPGCLEYDLLARAVSMMDCGGYQAVEYNLDPDEDAIWGEAIGCGGVMTVLLETVTGELQDALLQAKERNARGEAVWLIRNWNDSEIRYELQPIGFGVAYAGREGYEHALAVLLETKPRIVIYGAGDDALAISAIVQTIGFRAVVADWREELLLQERFPGAELACGTTDELVSRLKLNVADYLIVCSHNLMRDKVIVQAALPLQLQYIGVMGSKKRISLLFDSYRLPSNVRAPIGLSIAADGPDEIAVSIAAELIAVRAERRRLLLAKEGDAHAHICHLFSGGTKRKDGARQAAAGAGGTGAAGFYGAACAMPKPKQA